eukprot:3227253-Rhodomonas_salina.2
MMPAKLLVSLLCLSFQSLLQLAAAQNATAGFGVIQHVNLRVSVRCQIWQMPDTAEFNRTFLTLPGTVAAGGWICYTMELDNPTLREVT